MHILIGIIGIIFFLALAFCLALTEKYPLAVCWYFISYPTCVRVYFIENDSRYYSYWGISEGFNYLLQKAAEGVNFVFGGFKFVDPKTHHSSSVCYYQLYLFQH